MSTLQERMDAALSLVGHARHLLLGDAGLGLFPAGRCLEVLDLLEQAGAVPGADVTPESSAEANLSRAEAELDSIPAAQRPTSLIAARAELRAALLEARGL